MHNIFAYSHKDRPGVSKEMKEDYLESLKPFLKRTKK